MTESTLIILKPDCVRRGLIGTVLQRFENKGFEIRYLKKDRIDYRDACAHYDVHKGQPYFERLTNFLCSGECVIAVLSGENAIKEVRKMVGSANMDNRVCGTIRGDFSLSTNENIIHSSDSEESFNKEFKIFYSYFS